MMVCWLRLAITLLEPSSVPWCHCTWCMMVCWLRLAITLLEPSSVPSSISTSTSNFLSNHLLSSLYSLRRSLDDNVLLSGSLWSILVHLTVSPTLAAYIPDSLPSFAHHQANLVTRNTHHLSNIITIVLIATPRAWPSTTTTSSSSTSKPSRSTP